MFVRPPAYLARQQGSEVLLDDESSMLSHSTSRAMTTHEQPALLVMQQPCQLLQGKLHRTNMTHSSVHASVESTQPSNLI